MTLFRLYFLLDELSEGRLWSKQVDIQYHRPEALLSVFWLILHDQVYQAGAIAHV
jgi:hypothetical protein